MNPMKENKGIDWKVSAMDIASLFCSLVFVGAFYGAMRVEISHLKERSDQFQVDQHRIAQLEERLLSNAAADVLTREQIGTTLTEIRQELRDIRNDLKRQERLR